MKVIKNLNEISNELTLIDFFANWCGPCKMLGPVLEEFSEKTGLEVYKIDCDQSVELAREFNVQSIPALFLLKDKKVIDNKVGYMDIDELEEWINTYK